MSYGWAWKDIQFRDSEVIYRGYYLSYRHEVVDKVQAVESGNRGACATNVDPGDLVYS